MPESTFSLVAPKAPPATLASGREVSALPKLIAGQPVTYMWRPTISLGQYVHPATGQRFSVTADRMRKWVNNFRAMQQRGHAVYIPVNHSTKTEDNRGFVLDMRVNGPWLEELHQYIGDDAARDAARSKVSLNIRPLKDSAGNLYDEAIEHSSLVVNPVILGQGEPLLAASAGGVATDEQHADTYVLCDDPPAGDKPMPMQLTDEQVTSLKAALGNDLTPVNLVERVTQRSNQLSTCQTSLSAANQQVESLKLSANGGPALLSGIALSAMRTSAERAKNAAVAAGAITQAVADKLFKRLVQPAPDKMNTLALSVTGLADDAAAATGIPIALGVFEDLADNKIAPTGTLTGAQQVIDRQIPGAGGNNGSSTGVQLSAEQQQRKTEEDELYKLGGDYAKSQNGPARR